MRCFFCVFSGYWNLIEKIAILLKGGHLGGHLGGQKRVFLMLIIEV